MAIELPLTELRRALTKLAAFAHQDDYLPQLNVIRWHTDGKFVILTATDRYVAGRAKVACGGDDGVEPFEPFLMKLDDVRRLLSIFKPVKGLFQYLTFTPGHDWVMADETVTLRGSAFDKEGFPFPPLDVIFKKSLATAREAEPITTPRGWNPRFVAKFAVSGSGNDPVVFWPAPEASPVLVTVADWFYGIIMPVRVSQAEGQLELVEADFAEPPPAEPAKPARRAARKKTAA